MRKDADIIIKNSVDVDKCRYFPPEEVCQNYLENPNCNEKKCNRRHPKYCKWYKKEVGCRRSNFKFLHVTLAHSDGGKNPRKETGYKCQGCKSVFSKDTYVVNHAMQNMELWFCLNCDNGHCLIKTEF